MKRRGLASTGLALGLGLGGLVPTAIAAARPQASLITLDMVSALQGWAMNTTGQMLKTTDGGRQWINVASPSLIRAIQYAAKSGEVSLKPTRGGNLVVPNGTGQSTWVAFPNAWTAWVTLPVAPDAIQIWHTGDGGQQWTATVVHKAGPGGSMGGTNIAAVGNRDAWIIINSGALAGQVEFRVWRTSLRQSLWHRVFQGYVSGTSGLTFLTGIQGILAGGSNMYEGPDSASLMVTDDGGLTWMPPRSPLPLLPGNWATSVLTPVTVLHSRQTLVVPVLLQKPFPSKTDPLKTWWLLEQSTNDGSTWHQLPTPEAVLTQPPQDTFQAWASMQNGWVVLGSRLFRTDTAGQQWSRSALPPGTVINLSRVSTTTGFVLVRQGMRTWIYRTRNGGKSWLKESSYVP